ncbi:MULTISPECIES: DUF1317 family protein [Escherichia]
MAMKHTHDNIRAGAITFVKPIVIMMIEVKNGAK